MTGQRGSSLQGAVDWTKFAKPEDVPEWISKAYADTYQGPHDEAAADRGPVDGPTAAAAVTPALLAAHYRLGSHRPAGESRVAIYPLDDPAGFGPALQVVTDNGAMLMDSVTVLLHRLGVAYAAILNPVFQVRRNADGDLLSVEPTTSDSGAIDETWIHVQLSPSVDPAALQEAERLLPGVLADVRRVAADSAAMLAILNDLANDVETNAGGRYPGPDSGDVATLLRWLADGHFTLLGYQRCPVRNGRVSGDEATTSLGVLRRRKGSRPRLTDDTELLALAQTDVASYLRFGAYPYVIAVRENVDGSVFEHRLDRPVHGRRHERRRPGDSDHFAQGPRGARVGRPRRRPSGTTGARRHPDRAALGAFRAQRRAAVGDGQSCGGSRIGAPSTAVLAR